MKDSEEIDLMLSRNQLCALLFTSLAIFLSYIVFEMELGQLNLWFIIGSFLLFLPAYIVIYLDIADRPITHLWSVAMISLPVLTPFVYLVFRDSLKAEQPQVI